MVQIIITLMSNSASDAVYARIQVERRTRLAINSAHCYDTKSLSLFQHNQPPLLGVADHLASKSKLRTDATHSKQGGDC